MMPLPRRLHLPQVPAPGLRVSAPAAHAVVSATAVAPIFRTHAAVAHEKPPAAVSMHSTHAQAAAVAVHVPTPAATVAGSNLSAALPLPAVPLGSPFHGLSRSARFLKQCTGVNINALQISSDDEFWLFANMRLELQWVTSTMTPRRWVDATEEYNRRLQAKHEGPPETFVPKSARALHEKLKVLEAEIVRRISANDFICTFYFALHSFITTDFLPFPLTANATGTETFWKKQCQGVRVTKEEPGADCKLTLAGKKVRRTGSRIRLATIR